MAWQAQLIRCRPVTGINNLYMLLNRTVNLLVLLFVLQLAAVSQSTPKTLLWRISGHGLQQPSYLYGTMHLNDKRLFMFGDSVYHAIEQSTGLAIEVNPDEMVAYLVNNMLDQLENSKKLQDLLKENDFDKYSSALAKKFNKPAAEITTADVVKEKNKWMTDYMEKGEMPTFVDAYLYNIARRQGKWLGGIEDITDQAGLLEDMVDKTDIDNLLVTTDDGNATAVNKGMKKMIELYTDQDLDGMAAFSNDELTAEKTDKLLTQRNIKMARRMDSLMKLRTMFLAVGAAHLPGETGVIYLLRQRGFTVTPVFSSKKMDVKNYTFKEVQLPWVPVEDATGLYKTMMPANPATVKIKNLVDMKFLLDITTMTAYCSMAVTNPGGDVNKDSLYKNMSMRMFQTDQPLPFVNIVQDGVQGKEYVQEKKGANLRLQLFLYNKTVYVSFMYFMKAGGLHAPDAEHFFSALRINKNISYTARSTVFIDSVMGIRLVSPAALTYNKKLSNYSDEAWNVSAFTGTDLSRGAYVFLYSKELKAPHYVAVENSIDSVLYNNLKAQYADIVRQERWLQGSRITRLTGRNIQQPSFYMSTASVLRNGRNIVLLVIADSAQLHSPAIDSLFTSWQFIPHPAVEWKALATPGNGFSATAPSPFKKYIPTAGGQQYYAYDTSTAVTYSIIPDTISKYFWAKDDTTFWNGRAVDNSAGDSLVERKQVSNAGLQGIELLLRSPESATRFKRMRLLQHGDRMYKLFVSAERDFLYSREVNSFFADFRANSPVADAQFITKPKTSLLLQDLLSTDSLTRNTAYSWMASAPFKEQDRGDLQTALFKQYASLYDTTASETINRVIAEKLRGLDSSATIAFAKKAYNSFTHQQGANKNTCLYLLAGLHTKESYAALAELLPAPPRQAFSNLFAGALRDSLPLTLTLYPVLQKLAADTLYAGSVANIANELIDSGLLKQDGIQAAENDFINAADQMLHPLLRGADLDYNVYEILQLLGRYNNAPANKAIRAYLAVNKYPWLQKKAAIQLVKNAQPVPASLLDKLAADREMRITLYNELEGLKKKSLFPARFAKQPAFAEAALYNYLTDQDMQFSALRFFAKQTAVYKKKTYTFYLYKVEVEEEDGPVNYLGVQGGYTVNSKGLETVLDISGLYYQEKFDAKKINRQLAAYLKKLAQQEEEAGTE